MTGLKRLGFPVIPVVLMVLAGGAIPVQYGAIIWLALSWTVGFAAWFLALLVLNAHVKKS